MIPRSMSTRNGCVRGHSLPLHLHARLTNNEAPQTVRGPGFAGFVPWTKEFDQRSPQTTPLSRFRLGSPCPSPATHPTAHAVFQARCEITTHPISNIGRIVTVPDGSCVLLTGATGWKERDPILRYWLPHEDQDRTEPHVIKPSLSSIEIGRAHV